MAFQDFPDEVSGWSRAGGAVAHRRAPGLFAVHGSGRRPPSLDVEWTIDDPPCLVCRGEPARSGLRDSADVTPVYLAGGSPAVPTGLVFARFRQGVGPRSRAVELAAAGFEVRDVPGYAPNAAWLAHVSGRIEDALLHLPGLREVQDIEAFEPQLVMPAGRR